MRQQDTSVDVDEELRVAVKARQELGLDHEDEVIESFLERVQDTIDARVEARVKEELRSLPLRPRFASPSTRRIAVVFGFMTAFLFVLIPLADIAGALVGLVAAVGCVALGAAALILPDGKVRAELGPGKCDGDKEK